MAKQNLVRGEQPRAKAYSERGSEIYVEPAGSTIRKECPCDCAENPRNRGFIVGMMETPRVAPSNFGSRRTRLKSRGFSDPRLFIKICGIISEADLAQAVSAGADAVGFLVGKSTVSKRKIPLSLARKLVAKTPPFVTAVAVCTPGDAKELVEVAQKTGARCLQVHGKIPPKELNKAKKETGAKIIRSIPVKEGSDSMAALKRAEKVADAIVLDSREPGSGKTHNWSESAKLVRATKLPVILAGGLNPENVARAIKAVKPFAVDASTGVEFEGKPGKKSAAKIKAFVKNSKFKG